MSVRENPPNQAPVLGDHDSFVCDVSSGWWLEHYGALADDGDRAWLHSVGASVGSHEIRAAADRANRAEPVLVSHTRTGARIDQVEFDASWHRVLGAVTGSGVCELPWTNTSHGYLLRGAALEQFGRLDIGVMCPVSMTTAAIALLHAHAPQSQYLTMLSAPGEPHALAGMAMTEPQGGSDLSGSSVVALERADGTFLLNGHKWFVSHAVADVLFVLAREPQLGDGNAGLSCFAVPGQLDGVRNGIEILRLKDKLGTRSLASCEVLLRDAVGTRVGNPGAGIRTIIEMVVHTRMDCALGSTGIMARALGEAVWHTSHRRAFGARLIDQPLMRGVLTDIMIEREGALALSLHVAHCFDGVRIAPPGDDVHRVARVLPAIAKYYVTRRAVQVAIECCESLGGNGYCEEFPLARLYRDAQVNSTWEGSGNVIVLDIARAVQHDPETLPALARHVASLVADSTIPGAADLPELIEQAPSSAIDGRRHAGELAHVVTGALLVHRAAASGDAGDEVVAATWLATRVNGGAAGPHVFGDAGAALADAGDLLTARACVPA